jgi:AP-1 complex subunit sigma 1/2
LGSWLQVVYKRYASLYFVAGVEAEDNELITLEVRCCQHAHMSIALQPIAPRPNCLHFLLSSTKRVDVTRLLQIIHHFVEVLDRYFGNVCELDLIFNFHKVWAAWSAPCKLGHPVPARLCSHTLHQHPRFLASQLP